MIKGLLDKVKVMQFPDTAKDAMYDLIVQGDGIAKLLKVEGGCIYEVDTENGYILQVKDPFAFLVGRIKDAPGLIINAAKKVMETEQETVKRSLEMLSESGRVVVVAIVPAGSSGNEKPFCKCEVFSAGGESLQSFSDVEIRLFFKGLF